MALSKLKAKMKGIKYLPFEQNGITYNLYDLPNGFVIEGNLDISGKGLTELPDLSDVVVKGNFLCYGNQLTSLKGAPKEVCGYFYCVHNQLTSLEGAPQTVGRYFDCRYNQLTSLFGVPQLKENEKIYCDNSIGAKYGFSNEKNGIPYEDLCKSPLYRSEEAMNRVRIKQQQEQREKQQKDKINAEFSQWLKDNKTKTSKE